MTGPAIIKVSQEPACSILNKFLLSPGRPVNSTTVGYELEISREYAIKSGKDASVVMIAVRRACERKHRTAITASPNTGMSLATADQSATTCSP